MAIGSQRPFPPELSQLQDEIAARARHYGLDFFETVFELVNYEQMNEIAAFGGFPARYPHWRFGMQYEQLAKGHSYGLHRIYEMVINNDPCYAYLLESNSLTDQKLVMAHVYAHCDFFKNNIYFAHTNRKMIDEMANHAARISRYIDKYGQEEVESFIDLCMSIEDLIDIHSPAIRRHEIRRDQPLGSDEEEAEGDEEPAKFKSKPYMDRFINPPELIQAEREKRRKKKIETKRKFPPEPERDIMLFLIEHAPLENWQRNVLSILRDEAYYFAPQAQTKIMNEGWATYWHSLLMTRHGLEPVEVLDYADHHSGTVASQPGRINPYKLGLELFRDIEHRWNTGRFGPEYEACDDRLARQNWDKQLGLGRQKILEVRRIHNDVTFIDEFLTPDFCREHKLFAYHYNEERKRYEIESREFEKIKERLLFNLTNFGRPMITVVDGNYENRSELYLKHEHIGVDLKLDHAEATLRCIYKIWTRPVHLETQYRDKGLILSFDGRQNERREKRKE